MSSRSTSLPQPPPVRAGPNLPFGTFAPAWTLDFNNATVGVGHPTRRCILQLPADILQIIAAFVGAPNQYFKGKVRVTPEWKNWPYDCKDNDEASLVAFYKAHFKFQIPISQLRFDWRFVAGTTDCKYRYVVASHELIVFFAEGEKATHNRVVADLAFVGQSEHRFDILTGTRNLTTVTAVVMKTMRPSTLNAVDIKKLTEHGVVCVASTFTSAFIENLGERKCLSLKANGRKG